VHTDAWLACYQNNLPHKRFWQAKINKGWAKTIYEAFGKLIEKS
jgi:hypothetical protein